MDGGPIFSTTDDPLGYDIGLVCKNGHSINGYTQTRPEYNAKFCEECGEGTVNACDCGEPVRGSPHVIARRYHPPAHCTGCGKPFVWTLRKADALGSFVEELDSLTPEERNRLKESIPHLISSTPGTETAVLRVKKSLAKLKPHVASALTSILNTVCVEAAKKSLGL